MIPDFDPVTGFLPPNIHDAIWEEFVNKYGYTLWRKDLIKGLYMAAKDLQSCGCKIIYPDGGFIVNKKLPPKDIDVCWDKTGVDEDKLERLHPIFFDFSERRKKQKAKYGCEFFPTDMIESDSGKPFLDFFQQYYGIPKGILKINIEKL